MNKRKPYLFVTDSLGNGGQEKQLYLLIRELVSQQKECIVFVNHYRENEKYALLLEGSGIKIVYAHGGFAAKLRKLRDLIHQYKPAFVHSYTFHLNFLCFLACLGTPAVAIGAIRSIPSYSFANAGTWKTILNFIFPYHTISNNHTSALLLDPFLGLFTKKIRVVENGIEPTELTKDPGTDSGLITMSVGRLSREKNMPLMIALIRRLTGEGFSFTHEHYGDGVLLQELRGKVKEAGLEDRFIFKGETTDISAQLQRAALFIHTSDVEGTPNVTMEAMLQARAVLTTDCGDTPFLIHHNTDGFIVKKGDLPSLYNAAAMLLGDPAKRKQLGENARNKILSSYTARAYAAKTLSAYNQILNS